MKNFNEDFDEETDKDLARLVDTKQHLAASPLVRPDELEHFEQASFKRFTQYALLVNLLDLTGWHVGFVASILDTSEASLRVRMSRLGLRKGMLELPEACLEASDMIARYQARKNRSILTRY